MKLNAIVLPREFKVTIWISLVIIYLVCIFDFTGWIFQIPVLESLIPHMPRMALTSTINMLIAGVSLLLLQFSFRTSLIKNLVITLASIICLSGFATLYVIIYNIITGNEAAFNNLKFLEFFLLPEKEWTF